jgi:hypothetical protein
MVAKGFCAAETQIEYVPLFANLQQNGFFVEQSAAVVQTRAGKVVLQAAGNKVSQLPLQVADMSMSGQVGGVPAPSRTTAQQYGSPPPQSKGEPHLPPPPPSDGASPGVPSPPATSDVATSCAPSDPASLGNG